MRDHSQYVKPKSAHKPTLSDLQDYLKSLAKMTIPKPKFDRDELMQQAAKAEMARFILRNFFPNIEEDPEHVL